MHRSKAVCCCYLRQKDLRVINPTDTLSKLQEALDGGWVELRPGDVHADIGMWIGEPGGATRLTYARVSGRSVEAVAVFAHNGYIDGIPCFQAGYAVIDSMRRKGVATDVVSKGIEEMRKGFGRQGAKKFYVEAVVDLANAASNRLAKRLLSDAPETIVDAFSGESAHRYLKLIECST